MFKVQNKVRLKKYTNSILKNLLSSQFVYNDLNLLPRIQAIRIQIQSKRRKNVYFFFLWLLTNQRPYARKFNRSQKTFVNSLIKTKPKLFRLHSQMSSKRIYVLLQEFLFELISIQLNYEKKIWRFADNCIELKIPTVVLTQRISILFATNNYFPEIPLKVRLYWSRSSAFERIFFLRALKVLTSTQRITALDFAS
jgi:hypothetical protein